MAAKRSMTFLQGSIRSYIQRQESYELGGLPPRMRDGKVFEVGRIRRGLVPRKCITSKVAAARYCSKFCGWLK